MESYSDYRTLIRAALDGFWLLDGQGHFLDVNDAYCELIGYTRAEILQMSIAQIEANETPEEVTRHFEALKASGAGRFETRHRTSTGQLIDFEVSVNYDAAANIIFVFLRDISARLAVEKNLRQRTRDLVERVKELRCLLDLNTLIERRDLSLGEIFQKVVELLPAAWQYPAVCAAQLTLPWAQYRTANFQPSPWQMGCSLEISAFARGQLVVVYVGNPPFQGGIPFLPEEYLLLDAVAQRLTGFIQRRRAEEALLLREMSLNSLLELSQRTAAMQEVDIIEMALEEVERLTSSEIGYLHFMNPDQDSIQLFTWSKRTLSHCQATHTAHYPLAQAGIWADCARLKRPVIHNDYQNYPDRKGYPAGHSHLVRHLSVPVVEGETVKLIMGVGNKPQDYDDADVRQLMLTAEHLWRIIRRKRAENEARLEAERVAQSQEQLQLLSRRLVEVQEAERRRIARELHDEVGQVLTAVKINLQILRRQPALLAVSPRLDENIYSVQRALEQVRNLSLDLRPSILDDLGLSAALEWYAQRLTQMAGLKLSLDLPAEAPRWSSIIEITCFRVAQEALTNILRHAQARQVWIELRYSQSEVQMRVRDDGQGFNPEQARTRATQTGTSVGLLSMAERVALAGGQLEIDSAPGQGTSVTVSFEITTIQKDPS